MTKEALLTSLLSSFSLIDVALLALTVVVLYFVVQSFGVKKKTNGNLPPRAISKLPFFGHIAAFGAHPIQFIKNKHQELGDIFTAHIMGKEMTFLGHPRVYDLFFQATDDELGLREVYRFITPVFGRGIVYDTDTSVMMEQLKMITAAMTTSGFRRFVTVFQEESERKTEKMGLPTADKPQRMESYEMLSELIIFTASRGLLGDDVGHYLTGRNMAKHYRDIDNGVSAISFFFPNLPLPSNISRDRARSHIAEVFRELVKLRKEQMAKREEVSQDVLTQLLKGRYKTGERLPTEHVIGILLATLFAGQHTSSIAITWTLMHIISDKEVYGKVMQEQEKVLEGDLHADLTLERVRSMEYLERCLREALRMYPPLIMLMRYVKKQRKYEDMVIPKGNVLVVSPSLTGQMEDIYSNPSVFDPDRFLRGEQDKYPYANLSFGNGRHKCAGEHFAVQQIRSILSCMLRRYKMRMVVPMPKVNYMSLVVGPEQPTTIEYWRRTDDEGFSV